jgi:uncharacterized protein YkwD
MKTVIVFLISFLISSGLIAQIFQTSQLSAVIKKCYTDSVQKTERLAALKFHKLINQYRKENKIDSLAWDDTLWLASRNHNIWMGENAKLSHTQTENTKYFSGKGPGDRYKYATADKGGSSWSGENALYNYSDNGSSIEQISETMAKAAFNQWKNSLGHDENMRAPQSNSHGTAFYLEPDGPVWATDLFSYKKFDDNFPWVKADPASLEKEVAFADVKNVKTKAETVKKIRIKDAQQLNVNLLAMLEQISSAKTNKAIKKAAQKHANYIAYSKKLTHKEKKNNPGFYGATEKQRMMKASFGWYLFQQRKTPVSESIAQIQLSEIPSDVTFLAREVNVALDTEKDLQGTAVTSGYGVAFKQVKNTLNIYVVRVERVKPESQFLSQLSSK